LIERDQALAGTVLSGFTGECAPQQGGADVVERAINRHDHDQRIVRCARLGLKGKAEGSSQHQDHSDDGR
jgi:hypothetical protein